MATWTAQLRTGELICAALSIAADIRDDVDRSMQHFPYLKPMHATGTHRSRPQQHRLPRACLRLQLRLPSVADGQAAGSSAMGTRLTAQQEASPKHHRPNWTALTPAVMPAPPPPLNLHLVRAAAAPSCFTPLSKVQATAAAQHRAMLPTAWSA